MRLFLQWIYSHVFPENEIDKEIDIVRHTKNLTVVLIDMQKYYTSNLTKKEYRKIVSAQKQVIIACVEFNVPIVVLEYDSRGSTIPSLSKELELHQRTTIIKKPQDDGFVKTNLDDVLKDLDSRPLLLMGVNASGCVLKTAVTAVSLEYKVLTSENLIADKRFETISHTCQKWFSENGCFIR